MSATRNYLPLADEQVEARLKAVATMRCSGMTYAQMAPSLGMSASGLKQWMLQHGGHHIRKTIETSPRTCLKCSVTFPSWGPGNRRCQRCADSVTSVSPMAPDPGGSTGRRVDNRRSGRR